MSAVACIRSSSSVYFSATAESSSSVSVDRFGCAEVGSVISGIQCSVCILFSGSGELRLRDSRVDRVVDELERASCSIGAGVDFGQPRIVAQF